jgi:hypothetical protein
MTINTIRRTNSRTLITITTPGAIANGTARIITGRQSIVGIVPTMVTITHTQVLGQIHIGVTQDGQHLSAIHGATTTATGTTLIATTLIHIITIAHTTPTDGILTVITIATVLTTAPTMVMGMAIQGRLWLSTKETVATQGMANVPLGVPRVLQ